MTREKSINYVVGTEKRLKDTLAEGEVVPLLRSAVRGGALAAAVTDDEGETLWRWSEAQPVAEGETVAERRPILLEGEPVGAVTLRGRREAAEYARNVVGLLADTIQLLASTSLKRMLTTEIHTTVVNRSYEELLETNRKLAASETRYRELAESLEVKVRERTEELRQAYAKLLQREKMASVGLLAAGVAHEINNPMGFITSNLNTLRKYSERFREMLAFCRAETEQGALAPAAFRSKWQGLKLDFILADLDELLTQSIGGAERVKKIVADLKGFSHVDDAEVMPVDVNAEIDRTLNVLSHEIPPGTEIVRDYRPLPPYLCNPALLGQVFLNLVLNACEARREGLRLAMTTGVEGEAITIAIADNGPGVAREIAGRIFEPFFTTKEVGKGTGMGLAVVYDIVTGFGGSIELRSPASGGASFAITLPLGEA